MRAAENLAPPQDEETQPLGEVLAAAATELQHAYERGLVLENAILGMMKRIPDGAADAAELQHLDLVLQHVHAVSDFLGALAQSGGNLGAVTVTDALARVKLADVRDRLSGVAPMDAPTAIDDDILWG
jgi:hypothetical protein